MNRGDLKRQRKLDAIAAAQGTTKTPRKRGRTVYIPKFADINTLPVDVPKVIGGMRFTHASARPDGTIRLRNGQHGTEMRLDLLTAPGHNRAGKKAFLMAATIAARTEKRPTDA